MTLDDEDVRMVKEMHDLDLTFNQIRKIQERSCLYEKQFVAYTLYVHGLDFPDIDAEMGHEGVGNANHYVKNALEKVRSAQDDSEETLRIIEIFGEIDDDK